MVMSFSSNSTDFSSLHRTSDSWCLVLWQQPDFNCSGARRGHTSWKLSCGCGLMAIILEVVATAYSLCKTLQCLLPFSFSFHFFNAFYLSHFPFLSHFVFLFFLLIFLFFHFLQLACDLLPVLKYWCLKYLGSFQF